MFLNNYYHFPVDFTDEQVKRYFPAQLARQTSRFYQPSKTVLHNDFQNFWSNYIDISFNQKKKMHCGTRTKQGKKIWDLPGPVWLKYQINIISSSIETKIIIEQPLHVCQFSPDFLYIFRISGWPRLDKDSRRNCYTTNLYMWQNGSESVSKFWIVLKHLACYCFRHYFYYVWYILIVFTKYCRVISEIRKYRKYSISSLISPHTGFGSANLDWLKRMRHFPTTKANWLQ